MQYTEWLAMWPLGTDHYFSGGGGGGGAEKSLSANFFFFIYAPLQTIFF